MLLNAPALAATEEADPSPFQEHFSHNQPKKDDENEDKSICVFPNLGKDALLVVPTPTHGKEEEEVEKGYVHLLSFLRSTSIPPSTKHALIQRVAQVTLARCRAKEEEEGEARGWVWVSTSGLGVAWLHVRVEDRPKYYTCQEYLARGDVGKEAGGKSGRR